MKFMFTSMSKDCNAPIKIKGANYLTTEEVNEILNIANKVKVYITNKVRKMNTELKPNFLIR